MADELAELLRTLTDPPRGKGRLGEPAARSALGIASSEGIPSESLAGGGVAWPLTEQAYTGSTYYTLTDSTGFWVFEYPDETDYLDGNGDTGTVIHLP